MSKEGSRKCPDCDGDDFNALFGGKGDGRCSHCHGKGEICSIGEGLEVFRLDIEKLEACKTCSGTSQCQTCGGRGYQYYYEDSNGGFDYSYKEENKSSSYSGGDYSSTDYKPYTQKSNGDSSLSSIVGLIVFIAIVVIVFDNTCEKSTSQTSQPVYATPNTVNNSSSTTESNLDVKRNILNGKWVKVDGAYHETNEIGLVISFDGSIGTIVSVPNTASYYHIGQVKWKDFDPERNWLRDYINLSDSYINKEIKFRDSETLYIYGDIYKKQSSTAKH